MHIAWLQGENIENCTNKVSSAEGASAQRVYAMYADTQICKGPMTSKAQEFVGKEACARWYPKFFV